MSNERLELISNSSVPADLLALRSVKVKQALSQPYVCNLRIVVDQDGGLSDDHVDDFLRQPCVVRYGADPMSEIHGVLRSISMLSTTAPQPVVYRARLVPRMWLLSQNRRSQIFQDLSVPDIVVKLLRELGLAEWDGQAGDYELRLSQQYAASEYTVQYQETDLDFVHRLLEHQGIFYFFEQEQSGERVVFADSNRAFSALPGSETLDYQTARDLTMTDGVVELNRTVTPQAQTVLLRDYNWRTPSVGLQCDAPVDPTTGRGLSNDYGDHFKDPGQGARLAAIRAEEQMARRDVYEGVAKTRGLAPGHRFALANHPLADLDKSYAITEIEYRIKGGTQSDATLDFEASFTAIPFDVPFRPQRRTPQPTISGVMHARVDGEVAGTAAPIDEWGRYKILFPFDLNGQTGGKASRWVRLAQPASGPGFGVHFPLHIGAEVAVAHLNGDPDRPIIMNSPPNTETVTPVNASNATQNQIMTQAGIEMTWDDDC